MTGAQPELTPAEFEELNELAQWCHLNAPGMAVLEVCGIARTVPLSMLSKALDELARLRVEVETLRAELDDVRDALWEEQDASDRSEAREED